MASILSSSRGLLSTRYFGSKAKENDFSYTYQSPGSSIRDPLQGSFDTQEPVVLYDPPAKASSTRPAPPKETSSSGVDYTYLAPGSSVRDPIHISTSDPVHFFDPPKTNDPMAKSKADSSRSSEVSTSKYSYSRKKSSKEQARENVSSYTYQSPGSSIRDPLSISTSEPVIFYDPVSSKGIENIPGRINTTDPAKPKDRKYTSYPRKKVERAPVEEVSYTYASPGSSIRDPVQISTSDPVLFYDPVHPDNKGK